MKALPSHMYRDPLANVIAQESRTCKGCKHDSKWVIWGTTEQVCAIGRKKRNSKCYVETFGIMCQGGK